MKTIHRRKLLRDFTTLPNALLREKRLTFKARGLLSMMLSHSEEWNASLEWLEGQGGEGREAIRSAVKELEEMGYCVNVSSRENGQFLSTWTWYDEPVTEVERSNHRDRQLREAVNGKPSTANRSRETVNGNQHPQKDHSQKIIKEGQDTEIPKIEVPSPPPVEIDGKWGGESEKPKNSKSDWRDHNRKQADSANDCTIDFFAPPEFEQAWKRWCVYRTDRAVDARIASEALTWTQHAASAGLRDAERTAGELGWPRVCAHIDVAIGGNWQGLNFQHMDRRKTNGNTHAQDRKPGMIKF